MAKDSDYRNTVYCPVLDDVEKQKEVLEKQIKAEAPRTKIIYNKVSSRDSIYYKKFAKIYNNKCAYCGAILGLLPIESFEIDHFLNEASFPNTTEGRIEAGRMHNLTWSCISCNRGKRGITIKPPYDILLNVDNGNIATVFRRDKEYYIQICDTYKNDEFIRKFYEALHLGYETRRLDYLCLQLEGRYQAEKNEKLKIKLGESLSILLKKREPYDNYRQEIVMKKLENKLSGSYYTPIKTVQFMKAYLLKEKRKYRNMLEPSVGDGRFIDEFEKDENIQEIVGVELIGEKIGKLKKKGYSDRVKIVEDDFLFFSENTNKKYELIIGNPPYISIRNMEDSSKEKAKHICKKYQLPNTLMQNMWVPFVLAALSCLKEGGTIFCASYGVPSGSVCRKIRLFLEEHFDTIHILSFKERMFPDIEQESCLVYLTNEFKNAPYICLKLYDELDSDMPCYCSKIQRNKPLKKWTNAILSDEDIDLLYLFNSRYKKVSEFCEASPGIVTGANNEFILTKEQVEKLDCHAFILPTIPKSSMLSGKFIITPDVVKNLGELGERIYLLNLSDVDKKLFSQSLNTYLAEIGEKENALHVKLRDRYKCRNRNPWYGVPIVRNGDLFFFKRYDKIPRICVNEANIYTTDIAYNMRLNPIYDKESMAFCFYNSLTLTQCEYYGRYYAGGVCELTPSEFKKLVIPYREIRKCDIELLEKMIKENQGIEKIIAFVNSKTIDKEWESKDIAKIDEMRKKLMSRRIVIDK